MHKHSNKKGKKTFSATPVREVNKCEFQSAIVGFLFLLYGLKTRNGFQWLIKWERYLLHVFQENPFSNKLPTKILTKNKLNYYLNWNFVLYRNCSQAGVSRMYLLVLLRHCELWHIKIHSWEIHIYQFVSKTKHILQLYCQIQLLILALHVPIPTEQLLLRKCLVFVKKTLYIFIFYHSHA